MQHRTDRGKDILLGDERHLDIELIMLTRRAVGAARLVAEARRDLKIAVEAGHHQQLLELLRRLRQGVKLSGMQAARDQKIARPFGRAGGQDRRLKLGKALLDHPPADRGDDIGAEHDVRVDPLAPQIEKAIASRMSSGYSASVLTGKGRGSASDSTSISPITNSTSPVGSRGLIVSGERAATRPVTVTTLSSRSASTAREQR